MCGRVWRTAPPGHHRYAAERRPAPAPSSKNPRLATARSSSSFRSTTKASGKSSSLTCARTATWTSVTACECAKAWSGGLGMKASRRRGGSGRPKILVIEDDPVALAGLQARLEANGYVVARAADAASAMTVVNRERPALILLDLGLPAGDGFLVLERLRKIKTLAAIPVLVVTGRSDPEPRKRVEALGVPPVLVTRVQTEALLAAISEALETRSA